MNFDLPQELVDYLAELDKAQIEADPMNGAETAAAFKAITGAPPAVIERSKMVLTPPN